VTNQEKVSPVLEDKCTQNDDSCSWSGMVAEKEVTRDVGGEEAGHVMGT